MYKIRISAIICTYNRDKYLRKAVQSLVEQTLRKEEYEILVIDNGSSDSIRRVVCEEFKYVQNLRYIREPVVGLSQARNTGWHNAKGEYIAYLDDDAIASCEWLEKIIEVFETVKPRPGCVGGKIEPIWETPKPEWLSDKMLGQLTILDWSRSPIILSNEQWLAGANMAFPKQLLKENNGFCANLGRKGDKLLSMEEVLLRKQLERKGYRCFYHPEIVVRHHILPYRLAKRWFLQRAYYNGASSAFIQIYQYPPSALWRLSKGVSTLLRIFFSPRELTSLVLPTDNPNRFALKCSVWARIGYVLYLWGIAK